MCLVGALLNYGERNVELLILNVKFYKINIFLSLVLGIEPRDSRAILPTPKLAFLKGSYLSRTKETENLMLLLDLRDKLTVSGF